MDTRFRRGLRLAGLAALSIVTAGCWPSVGQGPDRAAYNAFENQISPSTVDDLEPLWTATLPQSEIGGGVVGAPVVSNRGVVVSDGSGTHSFRTDTGAVQWSWPDPLAGFGAVADPIADGNRVLVSYGIATGFVAFALP